MRRTYLLAWNGAGNAIASAGARALAVLMASNNRLTSLDLSGAGLPMHHS